MADAPTTSPLDADDPRISEWIDGRLAPSEAAEIERAVAATPELKRLVDDLRMIRSAMRATAGNGPRVDLGNRIMDAIAAPNGREPRVALPPTTTAPPTRGARSLPWLGLLGALAAGVLVTVVINLPNDNGREIALAPQAAKKREVVAEVAKMDDRRALLEGQQAGQSIVDRETAGRLERADRANEFGREILDASDRDRATEELASDEAPSSDALAEVAPAVPSETIPGGSERVRGLELESESAPAFASGGRGQSPKRAADAPSPSAFASAPQPAAPPAPTDKLKESATLDALSANEGSARQSASAFGQDAKNVNVDLAGVLVIAVTNPSERRALDRLVAESGLEATPEKDHLALVGKAADVDAFLHELARVGLVSAMPARRLAEAGKLRAADKKDARTTTLILRVVERQSTKTAPPQAGEAEATPSAEVKP